MDRVLLVSRDLLARARVVNAALGSGVEVATADPDGLVEALRDETYDLLILDLDAGGRRLLEGLREARDEDTAPGRVIGYFSHVDDDLGKAAELVGCEAIPRGRFWRTLPQALRAGDEPIT